jgi:N6-L-threonylcarbamoyladenine synthase
MLVLGIESSCDETAAAVVEDGVRVRSNVIATQTDLHAEYAGVVPEIASRAHAERMLVVVRRALRDAGVGYGDIGAIAVGNRPGLIGSLLVGVSAAKALSWSLEIPLVGVDHVHAHLYAGWLDADPPRLPALGLVVSGGHSSIYLVRSIERPERLGATIDDAVGEAFDKAAAILGIAYPGGPNLDRLASEAGADERKLELPISRLAPESLDLSFSGLKTALLYAVKGKPIPRRDGGGFERDGVELTHEQRRDFAASFQKAAVGAVVLKVQRALAHVRERGIECATLLVGGGVSANSRLRRELAGLGEREGLDVRLPRLDLCVDNAAMIAGLGEVMLRAGVVDGLELEAVPTTGV